MIDRLGGIQQTQSTQGVQQVTVDARAAEQLRSLSAGDSIQGRVVAINVDQQGNRTAQVDLGNGAMVNARLSANMSLQNGENVSFTVLCAFRFRADVSCHSISFTVTQTTESAPIPADGSMQ